MSVTISDTIFYGSANMPSTDGTTVGGAASFSTKVSLADVAAAGTVDYVSSSASDTATTIATLGKDSTGTNQTETKTLNGTTPVTGSQSFQRLLSATAGGTTAVGDIAVLSHTAVVTGTAQAAAAASGAVPASITLQSTQGASVSIGQIIRITNNTPSGVQYQLKEIIGISGDLVYVNGSWGTLPTSSTTYGVYNGFLLNLLPNQITLVTRPIFGGSSSPSSTIYYYAKVFAVNNNTTTSLTAAAVLKQTDPAGLYTAGGALDIALCTSLNDTGTVANRQTAPATGIGSWSSGAAPQSVSVPGSGNLPAGSAPNAAGAQGVWIRLTLPANCPPINSYETMRITGSTT